MSQRLIATLLTTTQPEGFQLYQGEVKSKWFHPLTWCLQSFLFVLAGHGARKHWWCCTRVAQNNTKMLTQPSKQLHHTHWNGNVHVYIIWFQTNPVHPLCSTWTAKIHTHAHKHITVYKFKPMYVHAHTTHTYVRHLWTVPGCQQWYDRGSWLRL